MTTFLFVSTWLLFLVISSTIYFTMRHVPLIRHRNPVLNGIQIACNLVIVIIITLEFALPDIVPCNLTLHLQGLFIPLWALALIARTLDISHKSQLSRTKFAAMQWSSSHQQPAVQLAGPPPIYNRDVQMELHKGRGDTDDANWGYRVSVAMRRDKHVRRIDYYNTKVMVWGLLVIFVVQGVVFMFSPSVKFNFTVGRDVCGVSVNYATAAISVVFFFVWLKVFVSSPRIREVFGVRSELFMLMGIAFFTTLFEVSRTIMLHINSRGSSPPSDMPFDSLEFLILLSFAVAFIISVVRPLYRVLHFKQYRSGAHADPAGATAAVGEAIERHLRESLALSDEERRDRRYARFRALGRFETAAP